MFLFSKKNSNGAVLATNIDDESLLKDLRLKQFSTGSGTLTIASNEKDLLKSSKTFKKVGTLCALAFDLFYENFIDQINVQSHTLKKIQGQLMQKIEGAIGSPMYTLARNYEQQRQVVMEKVKDSPEEITDALIYLHKRIFELGAHMASFEVLHMGEQINLDIAQHNIRRLLINILHGFEEILDESFIKPHFMFDDRVAEQDKIEADYKTLNAAFYNFFDNAVKYAKPHSEIRFHLSVDELNNFCLTITMKSLRIDQDELEKVFELGYRSRNCMTAEGTGVGMYVVKKALHLNSFNIFIDPDYSQMERYEGQQYILNRFVISRV